MVERIAAQVLFDPQDSGLAFLPEGPYSLGEGRFSWVAIQHGADSSVGSINIFDTSAQHNNSFELPGRPGFAFPTDQPGVFVAGVEHALGIMNTNNGEWVPFAEGIDDGVNNTIINDGITFDGNLLFGCKDLEFQTAKAGLYLWRGADQSLIKLRNDQTCSNGKALVRSGRELTLIDIDTPTKQVVRYPLDVEAGTLGAREVLVDFTSEERFPDGMILTPDGTGFIIAWYNPFDVAAGEAVQYDLSTGEATCIWECAAAPQVTCPQLIRLNGTIKLVLTTAVEHSAAERRDAYPNLGKLFIADTPFTSTGDQPVFPVPTW